MKDKRTYINKKEHGEDMTHENESKIDTTPIQLLTEQYKQIYINTKNEKVCIFKLKIN